MASSRHHPISMEKKYSYRISRKKFKHLNWSLIQEGLITHSSHIEVIFFCTTKGRSRKCALSYEALWLT